MEQYVVSRQLAEKLRGAGYPQHTEWFLRIHKPTGANKLVWHGDMEYDNERFRGPQHARLREENEFIGVPLSDELLEQMKPLYPDLEYIEQSHGGTREPQYRASVMFYDEQFWAEKSADALAQLWLFCKYAGKLQSTTPVSINTEQRSDRAGRKDI